MATSSPETREPRDPRSPSAARPPPLLIVDGNPSKQGVGQTLFALAQWSKPGGAVLAVSHRLAEPLHSAGVEPGDRLWLFADSEQLTSRIDAAGERSRLVVSLGGDGALLRTVGRYRALDAPYLGVNLGAVGFNASVAPDGLIHVLEAWKEGRAEPWDHMLLRVRLMRDGSPVQETEAVNEVVLHHGSGSRMLEITLRQGEREVLAYLADGLVVATPTGSTAYSLSAGGPILHPSLEAFVVSGLAPHALTSRAIVLATQPELELTSRARPGGAGSRVTVDGREHWSLQAHDRVLIGASPRPFRLINPVGYDYFENLRKKLHWSRPIRPLDSRAQDLEKAG